MTHFNRNDPSTWPDMKPIIIAHDVARSHDRSTAVVGGLAHYQPRLFGIAHLEELPLGLWDRSAPTRWQQWIVAIIPTR